MIGSEIVGNISYMEIALSKDTDTEFLAVTVNLTDMRGNPAVVTFNNSNGLIRMFKDKTLVVGQELIISRYSLDNSKTKTHYYKDGEFVALKCPNYHIVIPAGGLWTGSKPLPKVKSEPIKEITKKERKVPATV